MTVLYAEYHCPICEKTEKLIHEVKDKKRKFVLPGEEYHKDEEFKASCDYCNNLSTAFVKIKDRKFVGFFNENEYTDLKEEMVSIPDKDVILKKWKSENKNYYMESVNFKKQPFQLGKTISISGTNFEVERIYRLEWVERDLDVRLFNQRKDAYWYKMKSSNNEVKWMKIENEEDNNVFITDVGIVVTDNTEIVEEITENPERVRKVLDTEWFGGREIVAYQYINGVRIFVKNHKNEVELDVFDDTFEEAMIIVEENMELNVFNE